MVVQTTLPQVPLVRLELTRSCEHSGLNRARLPFHHSGKSVAQEFGHGPTLAISPLRGLSEL